MEQYQVTGMSCAACSARVEKAVSHVPGVTSCSVSLLTNSMGVEGSASPQDIIKAVEEAGYGASLKGSDSQQSSASQAAEALADHETPILKKRLIASVGFLLVLMYFSMGHRFTPFRTGQHILRPSGGYGIPQQRIDRHQFRGGLDIQAVSYTHL